MPKQIPNKARIRYAKSLRRNATPAERMLWRRLRNRQMENVKFRRQACIDRDIVDFVSFEIRLIIELDGGRHAVDRDKDIKRDRFLIRNDFKVLRFWNHEVLGNLNGVLDVVQRACLK